MRRHRWGLALAAIFLLALGLRLVTLAQLRHAPYFGQLAADDWAYDRWGQAIAAGDWGSRGIGVFYQAPLYPYFLGVFYTIAGHDLIALRTVQSIIGSAACMLLAMAGRAWLGARIGVAAGVLLAIYPTAIFFDLQIDKSVLDLALVCLLLWVTGTLCCLAFTAEAARVSPRVAPRHDEGSARAASTDAPRHVVLALLAGALLGLLSLTRENALALVPVIGGWLLILRHDRPWRRRLVPLTVFAAGIFAVLLPVAVRNTVIGGEFHLTTAQFGPNFYIGNNPVADGLYKPLVPGRANVKFERQDATELAEESVGRALSPGEVSEYWTRRAFAEMGPAPARWLALIARKTLLVWTSFEVPDSGDQYRDAVWSPVLDVLTRLLHFGTLVPLAAAGVVLTWDRRRRLWVLYLMVLALVAATAAFYLSARYRYPLVPLLVLFAAAAVVGTVEWPRRGRAEPAGGQGNNSCSAKASRPSDAEPPHKSRRRMVVAVGVALLAGVVVNSPLVVPQRLRIAYHYNLGAAQAARGDVAAAIASFAQALRIDPNQPDARLELGQLLERSNDLAGAAAQYREAVRLAPALTAPRTRLGAVLSRMGDMVAAEAQFQEVVRLRPQYAVGHFNLGVLALQRNRPADAIPHLAEATRLAEQPDSPAAARTAEFLHVMALAQHAAGQPEAATATARGALAAAMVRGQADRATQIARLLTNLTNTPQ